MLGDIQVFQGSKFQRLMEAFIMNATCVKEGSGNLREGQSAFSVPRMGILDVLITSGLSEIAYDFAYGAILFRHHQAV